MDNWEKNDKLMTNKQLFFKETGYEVDHVL